MQEFDQLVQMAIQYNASDLHLSSGHRPCCRMFGKIRSIMDVEMSEKNVKDMAYSIMSEIQISVLKQTGEIDFAYTSFTGNRLRINVFCQRNGISIVARILNLHIPTPEELRLPESVIKMIHKKRGLVLVTGPTGSGKSTTLASLLNSINATYNYHILTLEDPIEYVYYPQKSVISQREIGVNSKNYASALRAALRQDPDVILVGEMRDLETISTAVTAAETGHLVFSTLHTIGAVNTIDRIIDVFPPYQQQQIRTQLAEVLECVVSQQLLPRKDESGRAAAIEVMLSNNAIRNHIREAKTFQIPSVLQTNRQNGMITMDDAICELYERGWVEKETALQFSQDLGTMQKKILL